MRVYKSPRLDVTLEQGEEARLFEGIEAFVERIAALFDAVYAGRSSTAEARVYVFYDGEGRYLQRWLERSFKSLGDYGYERSIGWGRDPEWKVYRDFLLPGPKEREAIATRALKA
ncbi:hypothetical protein FHS83_001029 [Rhizomicrobium palustre]|uniref:DUF695 domain-containing protein n=1 Tax=Rhizomicrobium palustre TaxID=189966 RepID=A0A846MX42_9PROT|nr:hypothetical protein [Rhizomicrobium palustre]